MKRLFLSVIAASMIACGGGTSPGAAVATLTVTPAATLLDTLFSIGATIQLVVVARDADGYVVPNANISYSSTSPGIATVSNTGLITSAANGTTTVTISSGGVSTQRTVPVRQKFVSLAITPPAFTMVINTSRSVSAQARDALGKNIAGLIGATFTSTNTNVLTVGLMTGTVQAVALGTANVVATLTTGDGTQTGNSTVQVVATFPLAQTVNLLSSNSFDPSEANIAAGGTITFSNASGVVHNVTFAAGGPANVPDHGSGQNARNFPSAGTFNFQCTIHAGMSGAVIVH